MKKFVAISFLLPLGLLACSSSMPVNSQTNPLTKFELKNEVLPTPITSNSYILAEPLAGKKVKISITAKDKDLFITNCNYTIMYSVFEAKPHKPALNNGYFTCRSEYIIVPKGMTLTDIKSSEGLASNLSLSKTYYLQVSGISYKNRNTKQSPIPESLATSNEFKLIP